jgi:putative ABC transport system permease protein
VGVRKVLGASTRSLVVLLSTDFLKLVVMAFVVAAPLAWIASSWWLDGFAYHIRPGVGVFVGAAVIAVVIALVTVSTQAARAALSDPVKSLRYE